MERIHDIFAYEFGSLLDSYKSARGNNQVTRVEYLIMFIKFVVGSEVITSEPGLKSNVKFRYVINYGDEDVCEFLKEAVNETSLCPDEYVFLNKMIDLDKSDNFLESYEKIYEETGVEKCMLAPLFKKLFDKSRNLKIK